jgi:hypothetical protein
MSEPKRYTGKTEGTVLGSPHWEHPEGEWVKWDDYARLKAEVERLIKAGDAFYESEIGYYGEQILNDPKHHSGQMCRDWNAAKGVKS